MNKLFTLKKAAEHLGTTEEILFEYFRRKGIVSVYTKEFIEPFNKDYYHVSEKSSSQNDNVKFNKRCFLTIKGVEYFHKLFNRISLDRFCKKSQLEKRKNIKLCKEIYLKAYSFKVDSDEWYGFKEFDYFANNFKGFKDKYTIDETCEIFQISRGELLNTLIKCNWINKNTYLFYEEFYLKGVYNQENVNTKNKNSIFTHSYVSFDGLINLSVLLRVDRYWKR